jgi:hypothetical protein
MADTTTATAATPAAPAAPAFDPKGKNFLQRLDAFIADVKSTYKLTITRDSGRTAAWEQKMHICHMFLYNKFENWTPKNVDPAGRTIAWSHLSDAKVIWATVPFTEILRTSKDGLPTKDAKTATGWQKELEPDQDATEKQAKKLLVDEKIGDSGQAMVAAGLKPCGEPCGCGAGRSKHLEDLAADLRNLDTLTGNLTTAKAGDLDSYLAKFGLNRPLKDHPKSPEEWHVEAIP